MELVRVIARSQDYLAGNWIELSHTVAKLISNELHIGRVGVWRFSDDESEFSSVAVYDGVNAKFLEPIKLNSSDCPIYVSAIKGSRSVVVDDVYASPETVEFTTSYFPAFGITSMLDSAIMCGDRMFGVICMENLGPKIRWDSDSIMLAGSLADLISNCVLLSGTKRAQEDLMIASKLSSLGGMAGDILHEVANPLQLISNNLAFAKARTESGNPGDALVRMERAILAVEKVSHVFHSMKSLMMHKLDAPSEFRAKDLVSDVYVIMEGKFDGYGVKLEVDASIDEVTFYSYRSYLGQIVLNLLNNAVDAVKARENPWVKLEVLHSDDQNYFVLAVTDSGAGLERSVQSRIFDQVYSTKGNEGAGLGLRLCRSLIQKIGGDLRYANNFKNTRFEVLVPRRSQGTKNL